MAGVRVVPESTVANSLGVPPCFRRGDTILDRYPVELQAPLRLANARSALASNDLTIADREIEALSTRITEAAAKAVGGSARATAPRRATCSSCCCSNMLHR